MRVDDLDPPRVVPGSAARILDDLKWLGLDWDEGPDVGGPLGPYLQSERSALYEDALVTLAAAGLTYECFCSRAEIARASTAPHGPSDDGPRYPGTCRTLGLAEREARRATGRRSALRLRVPNDPVLVDDLVLGRVAVDVAAETGDFVVRRADGIASYQLATAVDDLAMEVAEVVRGADLVSSAARQLLIQRALGGRPPAFAHVPLLLAPDGERLAKRHGAVTVRELREAGHPSGTVVEWLFRTLGVQLPDGEHPLCQLLSIFDLQAIGREPTRLPPEYLAQLARPG
jgi:glutamyl-tRNA synthetase